MADPLILAQVASELTFPWAEYISPQGTTHDFVYSQDGNQGTMVIEVDWPNRMNAITQILGKSTVAPLSAPPRLMRASPWRCPYDQTMYASKIASLKGVRWIGKFTRPDSQSEYARARIAVVFTKPTYRILNDAQLLIEDPTGLGEYLRYTSVRRTVTSEFITREQDEYKFAQGTNIRVPRKISQRITKVNFEWTWWNVPALALFGRQLNQLPTNQLTGIGRVNDRTFWGAPAETLLFLPTEFREHTKTDADPYTLLNPPNLSYDVIVRAVYFDPQPVVNQAVARGWNVFPIPGDATGRWELITHNGAVGGNPLYAETDPTVFFQANYS